MPLPHDTLVPNGSAESVFEASRIAGRLLSTEIRGDVSDSSAHEETYKARSLRTQHGSLGCRAGIALARGRFRRVLNDSHFVFPQEALSPTAERSVLVRSDHTHESCALWREPASSSLN